MCSYVEKYAEFKNQTLKKIGWYTKKLCAAEYPGGGGGCQIVSWDPMNEKIMFLKNKLILGYVKMNGYHGNPVVQFLHVGVYISIQSYLS